MSSLRRSRPDEQDATLKRFQEISSARHDSDCGEKNCLSRSPKCLRDEDMLQSPHANIFFRQTSSTDQHHREHFFPPMLKISDLPSSPAVHQFEKSLNLEASSLGGQLTPSPLGSEAGAFDLLTISQRAQHNSRSPSPGRGMPVIREPTPDVCENSGNSSPSLPPSPKNWIGAEKGFDSEGRNVQHGKPSSSPSSPSLMLKHFKLFSMSGLSSSKRRGSEPILDSHTGSEFKKVQLGVTDRRWEKLRSILIAMKNEPVNIEEMLGTCPSGSLDNLQEKINAQEEFDCLSREVSDLNVILRQKESDLVQMEIERNCALAYIRRSKPLEPEHDSSITDQYYEQGIQGLKEESVTKEEVIEVASHLLKEATSQRTYLENLMSVVLTHAPWLLDHMNKSPSMGREAGDEEDDYSSSMYNESDDEVWC